VLDRLNEPELISDFTTATSMSTVGVNSYEIGWMVTFSVNKNIAQ
jgi:hypothetical protein